MVCVFVRDDKIFSAVRREACKDSVHSPHILYRDGTNRDCVLADRWRRTFAQLEFCAAAIMQHKGRLPELLAMPKQTIIPA